MKESLIPAEYGFFITVVECLITNLSIVHVVGNTGSNLSGTSLHLLYYHFIHFTGQNYQLASYAYHLVSPKHLRIMKSTYCCGTLLHNITLSGCISRFLLQGSIHGCWKLEQNTKISNLSITKTSFSTHQINYDSRWNLQV